MASRRNNSGLKKGIILSKIEAKLQDDDSSLQGKLGLIQWYCEGWFGLGAGIGQAGLWSKVCLLLELPPISYHSSISRIGSVSFMVSRYYRFHRLVPCRFHLLRMRRML